MIAFLVILALFVATVLLWLSMRKQLGRIDVDREGDRDDTDDKDDDERDDEATPEDGRS